MKTKQKTVVSLVTAAIMGTALLIGCTDVAQSPQEPKDSNPKPFTEGPVSIKWNGDTKNGIQTFQAKVEVYSMNNRYDTAAKLCESYRMVIRTVDEKIATRQDYDNDDSPYRSVISDSDEMIMFNPDTNEIALRIPNPDSDSPLYRILGNQSGLSRMNLSLIRQEAQRLSLDLQETTKDGRPTILLELPPELIPQNGLDTITRSRAVFDLTAETLIETEVVMIREDQTRVTTKATPLYEDQDGTPVKVGMVIVINSQAPGLIEGIDPDTPVYNSPDDDIPILTDEQFEDLWKTGNLHESPDITFGDPADLSYTETIYEVYKDIEINAPVDSLFRLIDK